nr:MAG TPA: Sorting Nexin 17 FERM C-terminal domain [Caudoviricetes sp.]
MCGYNLHRKSVDITGYIGTPTVICDYPSKGGHYHDDHN